VRALSRPILAVLAGGAIVLAPAGSWASDGYVHAFSALSLGRGLRFNNPYRLETQLGDEPESLSLTASYLDLALGVTAGDPHGFQHGGVAHLSIAIEGIAQEVGSLSYLLLRPLGRDFMVSLRGGIPVVLEPDLGAGLEIGAGGTLLLTGGMGVTAELVSSLFFGAATWENDPSLVPIVSFQIGAYAEYEVLP
jgi:hypothetical protein